MEGIRFFFCFVVYVHVHFNKAYPVVLFTQVSNITHNCIGYKLFTDSECFYRVSLASQWLSMFISITTHDNVIMDSKHFNGRSVKELRHFSEDRSIIFSDQKRVDLVEL